ncbi:MAG TPA: aminoglycoside phosphotransferase family protein [Anaerolineales bacterium]|nr:aminoglycoside phosphotransferase family protein [Anaerolineales bacterium]
MSLLQRYSLRSAHLIGKGMESQVYALDDMHVLKIYHRATPFTHLQTLQIFYHHLDARDLPYSLPLIEKIEQEDGNLYTIEKRLYGRNMEQVSREVDAPALERMLRRYIEALHAFSQVAFTASLTQYKLFDEKGISPIGRGDWHTFLARYVHQRVEETPCLNRDVVALSDKLKRLDQILSQPYTGKLSVIHGDFYPGNLLVDEDLHVTSLLDFGLFTMFGDHLFDVATACVFFDMYDQLSQNIRQRLLSLAAETYGVYIMGVLYRYILIYSLLSANIYAPDCSDGHYQWCVANLNHRVYWDEIR